MEDLGLNDLVVTFGKDGTVQVPVEKGVGLGWRVEPGPTHLDTIYFDMIPAAPMVRCREGVREGGGGELFRCVCLFGCFVVYSVRLAVFVRLLVGLFLLFVRLFSCSLLYILWLVAYVDVWYREDVCDGG